jgi:hypothetical protein
MSLTLLSRYLAILLIMVRLGPVLTAISSYTTARTLSSVHTKGHDGDRRGSIEMQVVQLPASTSSNQAAQGCVRAHHVKRMPQLLRTDRCPRRFSKGHPQDKLAGGFRSLFRPISLLLPVCGALHRVVSYDLTASLGNAVVTQDHRSTS